jgi:hypothetical protein
MLSTFKKRGGINSAVLWRGESEIDGARIVLIGVINSSNRKTGAMLQTYILRDDIDPVTANRTGADYSICGNCPLRGVVNPEKKTGTAERRGCYVVLGQGPAGVYKKFDRGGYPVLALDTNLPDQFAELSYFGLLAEYGRDQNVRAGTYGDPAAVPVWVWDALLSKAAGWTGYTHQMDAAGIPEKLAGFCMVSADSETEAREHWRRGRRTFRIVPNAGAVVPGKEIICPATKEGGERTTCERCGLCSGSSVSAKNIAAVVHGGGALNAVRALDLIPVTMAAE